MAGQALGYLIRQFETAWKLTNFHLDELPIAEYLSRPARKMLNHSFGEGNPLAGERAVARKRRRRT
jgi:hypothetical protein